MTQKNKANDSENRSLFNEYRKELIDRQLSNSEGYDKAILTLSTAALGFSIGLLKNIFETEVIAVNALRGAWILLGLSIMSAILSYITGQQAIDAQIKIAEDYYLRNNDHAAKSQNKWECATKWLGYAAGIFFIFGVACLIVFAFLNHI